jgi:hypothetical protein
MGEGDGKKDWKEGRARRVERGRYERIKRRKEGQKSGGRKKRKKGGRGVFSCVVFLSMRRGEAERMERTYIWLVNKGKGRRGQR